MVSTPTRSARPRPSRTHASGTRPAGPNSSGPQSSGPQSSGPGSPRLDPSGRRPGGSASRYRLVSGPVARFWSLLEGGRDTSGSFSYYLIMGSTLALTAIGLMMVLSSSAVESIASNESPYSLFLKQGMWACAGLVLMFLLSRFSVAGLKKLAWPSLILAIVLLALVFTPLGFGVGGNRNWLKLGPLTAQPSEAAKLALSLWMATVLARKGPLLHQWKHAVVPVLPVAAMVIGLVLGGKDLGTAMIMMMLVAAALFVAGAPLRLFGLAGIAAVLGSAILALNSTNRMDRIGSWLGQNCDNGQGLCMQSLNGLYALASGGWLGVGLGQSRQKAFWIPEAHNDFIFAIIGEELGLLGTLVVVALFGILAIAVVRVVMRHRDPFVRILGGSIAMWILGQAFVNMAMVLGLLPVIGVPLPFISYGGSALVFLLAGIGVIMSFARRVPAFEESVHDR